MASAKLGENAYASPADATTGVALADRFTEQAIRWLSSTGSEPGATWGHFVHQMTRARTGSTLEVYDKAWGSGWIGARRRSAPSSGTRRARAHR